MTSTVGYRASCSTIRKPGTECRVLAAFEMRWKMAGQGKRGGLRIIYYYKKHDQEIWMLTLYGKSEVDNIPAHILREIAEEIRHV